MKFKNVTVASAIVAGSVFAVQVNATTLYSGTPGALDGSAGDALIASISLSGAQTINYSITGAYTGSSGSAGIKFQLNFI